MKNKNVKKRKEGESTNFIFFIKTQLLCAVVYIVLFLISSFISLTFNVDKSNLFYFCAFAFAVSSFICGFFAAGKIGKNGMLIGFVFTLPFNVLTVFVSFLINSFQVDLTSVFSLLILFISSMLGGILAVNRKQKPKVNVRKGQRK